MKEPHSIKNPAELNKSQAEISKKLEELTKEVLTRRHRT